MLDVYVKDIDRYLDEKYHDKFVITLNCVELYLEGNKKRAAKVPKKYRLYKDKEPKIHLLLQGNVFRYGVPEDWFYYEMRYPEYCGYLVDKLTYHMAEIYKEWSAEKLKYLSDKEKEIYCTNTRDWDKEGVIDDYELALTNGSASYGDYYGFYKAFFALNKLFWEIEPNMITPKIESHSLRIEFKPLSFDLYNLLYYRYLKDFVDMLDFGNYKKFTLFRRKKIRRIFKNSIIKSN